MKKTFPTKAYPGDSLLQSNVERLIVLDEVQNRTGFKSSFIYMAIQKGEFPKPVKVGAASRWRESEIADWIQKKIESSARGKCSERKKHE